MKRRRMLDMTVKEAAEDLRRRYGARAAKVASDRSDDAQTESTANFYENVHDVLRDMPPYAKHEGQGGTVDAEEQARRKGKWSELTKPKPKGFDATDGAALLAKLVCLAKMQGSARSPFIVADLVGQDELYALQDELMQIIGDLAHQLGMSEYIVKALPYCFKVAEVEEP